MNKKIELELPVFDDSQSEIYLAEINANNTIKELYEIMVTCIKDKKYTEAQKNYNKITKCNGSLRKNKVLLTWKCFADYHGSNIYPNWTSFMDIKNYIPSFVLGIEVLLRKRGTYKEITYYLDVFLKPKKTKNENNNSNDLTNLEKKIVKIFEKYFQKKDKEAQELLSKIKSKIKSKIPYSIYNHVHNTQNSFYDPYLEDDISWKTGKHEVSEEVQDIVKYAVEKETKDKVDKTVAEIDKLVNEAIGNIDYRKYFVRMAGDGIDTIEKIENESYEDKTKRSRGYMPNNFATLENLYRCGLVSFIVVLSIINICFFLNAFYEINISNLNNQKFYFFMASFNAILWFVIYKFNSLYSEARRAKHVLQEKMMLLSVVEDEKFKDNNDLKAIIYTNVFERDFYIPRKTPETNTDGATILNLMKSLTKGSSGKQD